MDVIDAAGDPVIAILVAPRAVARKVFARKHREIGFDEARMVAVDGAHHPGPSISNAEDALRGAIQ